MEYFDQFKVSKKDQGVPDLEMNAPVVPKSVNGDVGLELEMEATNNLPNAGRLENIRAPSGARWATHADGSLRGSAIEYVLNQPCMANEIEPLVTGLYGALAEHKTKLALSNRCSTHVHLNIGGLKINEITSILGLLYTLEPALINWCGDQRKTNHFCLSSSDTNQPVEMWAQYLRRGRYRGGDGIKYSAINVLPIWRFGSIEVRTAPAFEDPKPVIDWATFLHRTKEFAVQNFSNPYRLAQTMSERSGVELVRDIAGAGCEEFVQDLIERSEGEDSFNKLCMGGLRNAQPFLLGFPWDRWYELCNAEYVPNPFGKAPNKNSASGRDEARGGRLGNFRFDDRAVAPAAAVPRVHRDMNGNRILIGDRIRYHHRNSRFDRQVGIVRSVANRYPEVAFDFQDGGINAVEAERCEVLEGQAAQPAAEEAPAVNEVAPVLQVGDRVRYNSLNGGEYFNQEGTVTQIDAGFGANPMTRVRFDFRPDRDPVLCNTPSLTFVSRPEPEVAEDAPAARAFQVGDIVRVDVPGSRLHNREGTVVRGEGDAEGGEPIARIDLPPDNLNMAIFVRQLVLVRAIEDQPF